MARGLDDRPLPAGARALGRRVAQLQEVLQDPLDLAPAGVALVAAQVPHLLHEMVEVQLGVEVQGLKALELARLMPGPGEEVALVEVADGLHRRPTPRRPAPPAARPSRRRT